jgi:hypothetical protein
MSELRLQQVALPAAAIASLAIMVGLLGDVAAGVCLGIVVLCTVITAPARRQEGGGWWNMLALGALVSVAGAGIALAADTVGGLIAAVGGVLVVVAATIGFPTDE